MERETADEIKRHFNVVADGLRSEVRLVAGSVAAANERIDRFQAHMTEELSGIKAIGNLRARLEKLETRFGN
jgi:hypothetical protein